MLQAQNVSYVPLNTYPNIANKPIYTNPTTYAVGATPAQASTNATGGFSYTIPIAVPPGTNDIVPELAIGYNSHRGDGILGRGWDLDGLSIITRGNHNIHFDGKASPVNLRSSDRFYLDGMRLTLRGGTYGANGATYRKESDDFSVVTSYGSSSAGPSRFELQTKDGIILEYGGSTSSRLIGNSSGAVMYWKLSKIRYPDGNYIEFNYTSTYRDHRISEVRYTGNSLTGQLPYNRILFYYKTRTDQNTIYEGGSSIVSRFLLDRISIRAESRTFKEYEFRYSYDGYRSLLNSIKEKGEGGISLNTTVFQYGNRPVDLSTGTLSTFRNQNVDFFSGDFDGDGYTDILAAPITYRSGIKFNSAIKVYKRTASSSNYSLTYNRSLPIETSVYYGSTFSNFSNLSTDDFNGDGRDDIMTTQVTVPTLFNLQKLRGLTMYTSTGSSFTSSSPTLPGLFNYIHRSLKFYYSGDFNGDGKTDYILFLSEGNGYKAYMTLGGTSIRNVEVSGLGIGSYPANSWVEADDIRVLDVDGDGKMELMRVNGFTPVICSFTQNGSSISAQTISTGLPSGNSKMYFGDFNGDGKTDMLLRRSQTDNNSQWYKYISTGKSGFTPQAFSFNRRPNLRNRTDDDKLELGDFNGDGKTDIMHGWRTGNGSNLGIYYSTGNGFAYELEYYGGQLGSLRLTQSDLNGDGRTDFIINRSGTSLAPTVLYLKRFGKEHLLHYIADGHSKQTNISYRRMTETFNFYSRSSSTGYPRNTVTAPIYLTQKMEGDDGNGGYFTKNYRYEDAYVHRGGKGFMGFRKFRIIDLDNNTRTESEYYNPSGIYLMTIKRIQRRVNSTNYLFEQTDYNHSFVSRPGKSYWLRTNSMTENQYLETQTENTTFTYDAYGNVTRKVESNGIETITTSSSFRRYAGPVPNRPNYVGVLRQRSGQQGYHVGTTFTYNSKGQLTSKKLHSGLPRQITIDYSYDGFGNVNTETKRGLGMSSRHTTLVYDSKGRFVIRTVNTLGQATSATYDNKWGKPITTTDIGGLVTRYRYDAFGRLIETTLPTGSVITESYVFNTSPAYGSTYYHQTSQIGKPTQWVYYDNLDRKIRHHRKGYQNATVYEIWTYDSRGRLKTERAPYKSGESTFTTTYNYDTFNRPTSEVNPFGTTRYSYSYSSGKTKLTKTNPAGQVSTIEMDASGRKTKTTDNGGTLTFTHTSLGKLKEVKLGSTVLVSNQYDSYGNKTRTTDKNGGTFIYEYNVFKELAATTNGNGHRYTMNYDRLGRITGRKGPGEDIRYSYVFSGPARTKISKVINNLSQDQEEFFYDSYGRVNQKRDRISGTSLTCSYTYDNTSKVTSKTYPSGLRLLYTYDFNGYLTHVRRAGELITLFTIQSANGRGQHTSYKLGNNRTSTVTYNQGIPTRYYTAGIQDLRMNWNYANGNLNSRQDVIKGRTENFTYDNLNRLRTARVVGQPTKSVNYASNGNITSKTDVGSYTYPTSGKINAILKVSNPNNTIPTVTQDITYNGFDQPTKLKEGSFELDYTYGYNRNRNKSVLKQNGSVKTTRLYLGDFERQMKQGATKDIHYVNAGQGTIAIVVKENNSYKYYYTYTDHLGSIVRVTDRLGNTVAEQNFDPWGRKRNVNTWTYSNVNSVPDWLYRGYTGHEDMPEFRLINMNGRMYDPIVGRMLSVDNYVQAPNSTQSYNRYSYVFNNPLSYTDPNGELAWFVPIIIGAVVGAYAGASIASGSWDFTQWDDKAWKGAIVGAFIGAALGAIIAPKIAATGIKAAAKGSLKGFKFTVKVIKKANLKMATSGFSNDFEWDLDKMYKSALVGAGLEAFNELEGLGVKLFEGTIFGNETAKEIAGSVLNSMGKNWIKEDGIFSSFTLDAGVLRTTFNSDFFDGKWFSLSNQLELITESSFKMVQDIIKGDVYSDFTLYFLSTSFGKEELKDYIKFSEKISNM
ncbi:MAG: FG-GAP-like repeat-containing protein [Bacteroidota bacterium]